MISLASLPPHDDPATTTRLCWVSAVRSGAAPDRDVLFLSLDCDTVAPPGPHYVLTHQIARELVESLRDSLAVLDAASKRNQGPA